MKKVFYLLFLFLLWTVPVRSAYQPQYSVAGFYPLEHTGREVYSMNPVWRFYKGSVPEAYRVDFDDDNWAVVSLPDGIEYLPTEASGCIIRGKYGIVSISLLTIVLKVKSCFSISKLLWGSQRYG